MAAEKESVSPMDCCKLEKREGLKLGVGESDGDDSGCKFQAYGRARDTNCKSHGFKEYGSV